ncbi:MAG: transposase [Pseudorhodoplanes sp.]|nr:transposase [Pseudorhodoplanes sp.]
MPGSHAVVLLDGAGWHQTGGKLKVPHDISLLKLPAYSHELNPVKKIWQHLRQNQFSQSCLRQLRRHRRRLLRRLEYTHGPTRSHPIHRNLLLGIGHSIMRLV